MWISQAGGFQYSCAMTSEIGKGRKLRRLTDQKAELGEDAKALLDQKQRILSEHITEHPEITVTWFQPDEKKPGGKYLTVVGELNRVDGVEQVLLLTDGTRIPLEDVTDIRSPLFDTTSL